MTYYLLSAKPDGLEAFQKRIPALADAIVVGEAEQLSRILPAADGETFFLVDLKAATAQVDDLVLAIKVSAPAAKVIYIIDDNTAHNLRVHQSSSVGGDAYVQAKISAENFSKIVESLTVPAVSRAPVAEKTVSTAVTGTRPTAESLSKHLDEVFSSVAKETVPDVRPPAPPKKNTEAAGEHMAIKEQELSLGELDELDFNLDESPEAPAPQGESGLDLKLDEGAELELGGEDFSVGEENAGYSELSLDDAPAKNDGADATGTNNFSLDSKLMDLGSAELDLGGGAGEELSLTDDADEAPLNLSGDTSVNLSLVSAAAAPASAEGPVEVPDLSEATRVKLKEIDELMIQDASKMNIHKNLNLGGDDEEEIQLSAGEPSAVLDLGAELDFNTESKISLLDPARPEPVEATRLRRLPTEDSTTVRPVAKRASADPAPELSREELAAYSGNLDRTQATIANLRADREELLAKIQKLEEEKVAANRQNLTLRAELDETKIILTIARKKMTEEINDLKSKMAQFDERKRILEEKNKMLTQELEKAGQRTRFDVKKVQQREKELEQKLELLKADAETQIRNRDLKILELKRKIDAMEFDMESISTQEKRSVESRYELEDKLEKAIRTLKGAISELEEESDRSIALDVLKKNIDV